MARALMLRSLGAYWLKGAGLNHRATTTYGLEGAKGVRQSTIRWWNAAYVQSGALRGCASQTRQLKGNSCLREGFQVQVWISSRLRFG